MQRRRKVYPVPEAIPRRGRPKPWKITSGSGAHCNPALKTMHIPTASGTCGDCGNADHNQGLRSHEMMHVAWSPKDGIDPAKAKVSRDSWLCAEDMRLEFLRIEKGLGNSIPGICAPELVRNIRKMLDAEAFSDAMRYGVLARHNANDLADTLPEAFADAPEGFAVFVEMVSDLCREVFFDYREPDGDRRFGFQPESAVEVARILDRYSANAEAFGGSDPEGEGEPNPAPGTETGEGDAPRWGRFTILEPSLTLPAVRGLRKVKRHRDFGVVPKAVHRLPIDGKVFQRYRKVPGGTILVDDSGSMGWDESGLSQILESAPGATVAVYAGDRNGDGYLKVVARNGKRLPEGDIAFPFGDNLVDGPALQWLGNQPGPRIWVSDGQVTGVGGWNPGLVAEATRLVVAGDIYRVREASDAAEILAGTKPARRGLPLPLR